MKVACGAEMEAIFLAAMAKRYVWDKTEAEALAFPDRIILRVMDLSTLVASWTWERL